MDKYKGNLNDKFTLKIYDNSTNPSKVTKISSKITDISNKNYEFKCEPTEDINGTLYLATFEDSENNSISIQTLNPSDDILIFKLPTAGINGSDNEIIINRGNLSKKKSSGLSGGAIAGIVIVCVVAIIAVSIIAVKFTKPKDSSENNSSAET